MDPISIAIEIELGSLLLAMVGGIATWMHHRQQKAQRRQRDMHHRELALQQRRQHREQLAVMRAAAKIAEEVIEVHEDEVMAPIARSRSGRR